MRKFHRERGQRRAFLKGLAHNLIMKERIQTTVARAKEIRPFTERLISMAKKQNLSSLRLLISRVNKEAAHKLYYEIAPRYKERQGGYLRIIKLARPRQRDGSSMAAIEFLK